MAVVIVVAGRVDSESHVGTPMPVEAEEAVADLPQFGYTNVEAQAGPLVERYTGKLPIYRVRAMWEGVVYWAVEFETEAKAGAASVVSREILSECPPNQCQAQVIGPTFFYAQDTTREGRASRAALIEFAADFLSSTR